MNKIYTFLTASILATTPCLMSAQAVEFYETDFNTGLPSGFKVLDLDESPISENHYRNVDLAMGWSVNKFENAANKAAMSLSRMTEAGIEQSNWLITPQISVVSDKAVVRWDARSILSAFPEKYKVMISTTTSKSSSFTEIASIDEEASEWTTHIVSLADYVGEEIYIAFVCQSTDKFILAIDNLTIGELSDEKIIISDTTPRYCGNEGSVIASGSIFNAGADQNWQAIIATTADGEQEFALDETFKTNTRISYEFEVPVTVGEQAQYTISFKKEDGTITELLSDNIICSYFKRNVLIDKTTGTWCNNCPDGDVFLKPIKKRYKGSLITINSHYNDPMACMDYFNGLYQWIFNLPTTIVNRDRETITNISFGKFDYSALESGLTAETIAQVNAEAIYNDDESMVEIFADVQFAKDLDNSSDIYKLGYALVENTAYQPTNYGYIQQNNSTLPRSEEYYLLPTLVPQDIMVYNDVVREGSTAFSGVDNSLPQTINAYDETSFQYSLTIPKEVIDKNNLDAVVFIINRETDIVMNAVRVPCTKKESVNQLYTTNSEIKINISASAICNITFPDTNDASVDIYATDGTLISHTDIVGNTATIDLSPHKGLIIVKAQQNGTTTATKAIIK